MSDNERKDSPGYITLCIIVGGILGFLAPFVLLAMISIFI